MNINVNEIIEGIDVEEMLEMLDSEGITQDDILVAYTNHGGEQACRQWIMDNFDELVEKWSEEDEVMDKWGDKDESEIDAEEMKVLASMMKYVTLYYIKWIFKNARV